LEGLRWERSMLLGVGSLFRVWNRLVFAATTLIWSPIIFTLLHLSNLEQVESTSEWVRQGNRRLRCQYPNSSPRRPLIAPQCMRLREGISLRRILVLREAKYR
jgi:hypothetical protein